MVSRSTSAAITGSDALLKAALGSMPYGFSIWDESRCLVLFNQHYLNMYKFPPSRVYPGISLKRICELTIEVGNVQATSVEELLAVYNARFDSSQTPDEPIKLERAIRGRVIETSQLRRPGLGWIVMHEDITQTVEQQWMADLREKNLADQNMRFDAALGHMTHGLSMYDAEHRLLICNERYREMYGMPDALTRVGTSLKSILDWRRDSGVVTVDGPANFVEQVLDETSKKRQRVQVYRMPDGRTISVTQSPMPDGGFVTTHQDVTADIARMERVQAAQAAVEQQNLRFAAAVNNMSQGLCMFDKDSRLVICNEPYARIYDLPVALMRAGTPLSEILDHRFSHGMVPKQGRDAYINSRKVLVTQAIEAKDELEMEDGRTILVHHHPMPDGGWVATHEDITEQRQMEARVRHLARHDALTDLPNRVLLHEEMDKLEARIQRQETVAVLCLDLDHFKAVNDTLGHGVGDQVLVAVAKRLRDCSRETDVVARLGGDEFALLVHSLDGPRDAAVIADRIVKSIAVPIQVDNHQILIGASVGIAVAPFDGADAQTLLKNADMALYRAKNEGRGNFHFFEKGMDEALQHRRMLEQGLKVALGRGEFRLVYQPLINLEHNRICCLEALLRWDHPERGLISPAEFIPIAEETGVIASIGEWVLREACRAAAGWPDDVRIAVNLSPVQFKNRGLVNHVVSALTEAGLAPDRLELEITESLLLADTELTLQTLHRLREIGVRISMDDFGTGYSSLSYLRSFPFDKIKIDRTFMNGASPAKDTMAIIKAVISLGQSLGMSTTAEGIETEEQLEAVRAQGCNEVQGFLFSPPISASGVNQLLSVVLPRELSRKAG